MPLSKGKFSALKVFRTLDSHQRRSLLILFVAGLFFWADLASLLPTLPLYVEHIGGNKQEIGLVMGAFALGLLPSRAWLGPLADRRGRKIVLVLGTVVAAIAPLGYLIITSVPSLMALRAFHGISIAAFSTGYSALVADLSPPRQRGELLGYMSLVHPIGLALGPAIGGFVQESLGYPPLFFMVAGLGMVALFLTLAIAEPSIEQELPATSQIETSSGKKSFWGLLWSHKLRIPALVLLLIGMVFGTLSTFVPLFVKQTGVDLNPGWFYSTAAVASFAIRLPTGRASDRHGRGLFITGSLVFYVLSMLTLWIANSPSDFLLAGLLEGAASGTLLPMLIALTSDRSLPQERGRYFSLCLGGFDFGLAMSGPIIGAVAEYVGLRNMFAIAAVLSLAALLVFVTMASKDLPHSLRFAIGRERDVYALKEGLEAR